MPTNHVALIALVSTLSLVCGCEPQSQREYEPQVRIVGDLEDVGAEVFVDGRLVTVLREVPMSMPEVTIKIATGHRVVEIRKNGSIRNKEEIDVTPDSGIIPMAARR